MITLHRLLTMSVEGYPFRPESDSYKDSMRPLIEKDIAETEKILTAFDLDN